MVELALVTILAIIAGSRWRNRYKVAQSQILYAVSKLNKAAPTVTFRRIIEQYRQLPRAATATFRSVLLSTTTEQSDEKHENDENDEATTFNGTIPQALMMMNSDLIEKAVSAERGSFLFETFSARGTDRDKMNDLYLAALSRKPSPNEAGNAAKLIRGYRGNLAVAYQDLFWALLNSNEFILNH